MHTLFDQATLPAEATEQLHKFLASHNGPLAVRSSSLFEDAFMQPFAGIYSSEMLPNAATLSLEERLEHLSWGMHFAGSNSALVAIAARLLLGCWCWYCL